MQTFTRLSSEAMVITSEGEIPIASRWRWTYWRFRRWLGVLLYAQPKHSDRAFDIGFGQFLLESDLLCTFQSLEYIAQHTSIPVPRIQQVWRVKKQPWHTDYHTVVILDKMPGITLGEAWPALSKRQRRHVLRDLGQHLDQLRSLRQPDHLRGQICNPVGAAFFDNRLRLGEFIGPIRDLDQLMQLFLKPLYPHLAEIADRCRPLIEPSPDVAPQDYLVLTHGDLWAENIMVDVKECKITAILDWTSCAWMPPYFERYKAEHHFYEGPPGWIKYMDYWLDPYTPEVAAMRQVYGQMYIRTRASERDIVPPIP